ncbi:TadA family conjugal transfer-associated ATPase [Pseudactinotalea sp. Z1748]|uniref:TadA family conjugal transfer-associated ATPase n=1 Tax=Pseudactinotalea sp. Z1748 TaxID=3413027 RepID=UPI003C7DC974
MTAGALPEPVPVGHADDSGAQSSLARIRTHLAAAGTGAQSVTTAVRSVPGLRSDHQRWHLARSAHQDVAGAGVLQPLLDDPEVTDVLVNGPGQVWLDRGAGLQPVDVPGLGPVRALATRLAGAAGQRLDDAAPVAEGRLPDGTRLHAVLAPLATVDAVISLRSMRRRALSLAELREQGFVDGIGAQILDQLVQVRANVMVSGATGAGKTTLLAAMLSLVPGTERILCIEEAAELIPDHPHVVHLQVRRSNVQGAGGVGLDQLVRTAMRMRPDRLVLGECRGAEVREVLGALNTGHDGGWATVHANAAGDVPARLVALGSLAGLDPAAVAVQAASALDAIVHLRRDGGRRYLDQIAVMTLDTAGAMTCPVAMSAGSDGAFSPGPAWPALAARLDAGPR